MITKEFDELVEACLQDPNTLSARVVRGDGAAPILVAHVFLDGREYIRSLIPTDLSPVEEADG